MTIRDLVENGVEFEGPVRVIRYALESDDEYDVLYSEDGTPDHIFLTEENEDFVDSDIRYIYPAEKLTGADYEGNAWQPQIVIEVL